ncbi:MAG: UvrB/UvrC motif-containing protein [Planctomycetota bacterium]
MQFCSACKKAPASIVIMDLDGGSVTGQQHLCTPCAEQLGVVQQKTPLKMSPELLEDLLGSVQTRPSRGRADAACAGCGITLQHFKTTGRLGCPRCYETFRQELMPLLQRVHEASSHRGRLPSGTAAPPPAGAPAQPGHDSLVDLRRRLDDAVRGERYEEAARLRDELRRKEQGAEDEHS